MKEENDGKVYARSNFDLNKVIHTSPAASKQIFKNDSNNLPQIKESLNFIMDDESQGVDNNDNEEFEDDHNEDLSQGA